MSLPRKAKFAKYLTQFPNCTAEDVMRVSKRDGLGIQVKTLGAKDGFVIKFDERDSFIKPHEWLHNYKVQVEQRYKEASNVYYSIFPQETKDSTVGVSVSMASNTDLKEFYAQLDELGLKIEGNKLAIKDYKIANALANQVLLGDLTAKAFDYLREYRQVIIKKLLNWDWNVESLKVKQPPN